MSKGKSLHRGDGVVREDEKSERCKACKVSPGDGRESVVVRCKAVQLDEAGRRTEPSAAVATAPQTGVELCEKIGRQLEDLQRRGMCQKWKRELRQNIEREVQGLKGPQREQCTVGYCPKQIVRNIQGQ